MTTTHVIGGGLAGLSAAIGLAGAGRRVLLHEQAQVAGGRCRSYFDRRFGRALDTGIHLTFSGQRGWRDYLAAIGAADRLVGPDKANGQFVDLRERRSWSLRPNGGDIPWWIVAPGRAVPRARFDDYVGLARLCLAGGGATVADCMPPRGPGARYFWEPFCVAALNTPPSEASASELWRMLRTVLGHGAAAWRPRFAREGHSADFVDPALAALRRAGAGVRYGHRLTALEFGDDRVSALHFARERVALDAGDAIVLAVPSTDAGALVPDLQVPRETRAIVVAHFELDPPVERPPQLTCVIDDRPYWLLTRHDLATVTIGAADDLVRLSAAELARRLWARIAAALQRSAAVLRTFRVLKFRDGTFAHTPDDVARRPATQTRWRNLFLAGDWTATGLPAMIEGAVISGRRAAQAALAAEA